VRAKKTRVGAPVHDACQPDPHDDPQARGEDQAGALL
jgi:hypothetical protein